MILQTLPFSRHIAIDISGFAIDYYAITPYFQPRSPLTATPITPHYSSAEPFVFATPRMTP